MPRGSLRWKPMPRGFSTNRVELEHLLKHFVVGIGEAGA